MAFVEVLLKGDALTLGLDLQRSLQTTADSHVEWPTQMLEGTGRRQIGAVSDDENNNRNRQAVIQQR